MRRIGRGLRELHAAIEDFEGVTRMAEDEQRQVVMENELQNLRDKVKAENIELEREVYALQYPSEESHPNYAYEQLM